MGKQDQQHQQQSNREINKGKGKHIIHVMDFLEQSMKAQQLQEITKTYGNITNQEIRKESKEKKRNIAMVTFSNKIPFNRKSHNEINESNIYIAKMYYVCGSSDSIIKNW